MAYTGNITFVDSDSQVDKYYEDVATDGNFLYTTYSTPGGEDTSGGIVSYSADENGDFTKLDEETIVNHGNGVAADSNWIYVASFKNGFDVFEADGSGNLTHKGNDKQTNARSRKVCLGSGSTAGIIFVADEVLGIMTYTVNGSGVPTFVDNHVQGPAYGCYWTGSYLLVANYSSGISSYSVDGSGNLTFISNDDQGSFYHDVSFDGSYVYVANQATGVMTYTLNPSTGVLTYVTQKNDGYSARGISEDGAGFIYVAAHTSGTVSYSKSGGVVTFVDVDDPGGIARRTKWFSNYRSDFLFMANYDGGIVSFEREFVTPPNFLEFVGLSTITFTTCYEILMPIDTKLQTLEIAHRADNNTWNTGKKTNVTLADNVIREIRLALRIHRSDFGSLESFLEANYNEDITVQATGHDLFDDDNRGETNDCRIVGFTSPVRELTNWYRIDINLVKI